MFRDYRDRDVQFFYVYKSLAHPEVNGLVPVFTIDERVRHIAKAKRMMKTEIPWICDTLDNRVKDAFGGTFNGEFILDPDGVLIEKRYWSVPRQLRKDLAGLVGPAENVTRVEDLPTVFKPEPRDIASGVMPRPLMPQGLQTLNIRPQPSDDPFFAKLRVEAVEGFFEGNKEVLYFTVYLDPIHEVHWNNEAGKVTIEVEAEKGDFEFARTSLESIDVKVKADVDPRWMIVDARALTTPDQPFRVTVNYTVCDDAETFCKPIQQSYLVYRTRDADAGTRPGIFLNGLFANIRRYDMDGNQQITAEELPAGRSTMYIGHLDYNGNEVIEFEEIDRFMEMFRNGRGIGPANDGG